LTAFLPASMEIISVASETVAIDWLRLSRPLAAQTYASTWLRWRHLSSFIILSAVATLLTKAINLKRTRTVVSSSVRSGWSTVPDVGVHVAWMVEVNGNVGTADGIDVLNEDLAPLHSRLVFMLIETANQLLEGGSAGKNIVGRVTEVDRD